jgi:hypothetical protein
MISADDPSGMSTGTNYTSAFSYNPEGLRTGKSTTQPGSADATNYFYEYSHVVLETDANGAEKGFNIY